MHDSSATQGSRRGFLLSPGFLLASLLLANVGAIVLFILQDGSIMQALWIYWAQSVIIGLVNVVRILTMPINGLTVPTAHGNAAGWVVDSVKNGIRGLLAVFFVLHYGGFHFGYFLVLMILGSHDAPVPVNGTPVDFSILGTVSAGLVVLAALGFAVHHSLSFVHERRTIPKDQHTLITMANTMTRPYARILPMHIIVMIAPFGAMWFGSALLFIVFMAIKTVVDVLLYRKAIGHPKVVPAIQRAVASRPAEV